MYENRNEMNESANKVWGKTGNGAKLEWEGNNNKLEIKLDSMTTVRPGKWIFKNAMKTVTKVNEFWGVKTTETGSASIMLTTLPSKTLGCCLPHSDVIVFKKIKHNFVENIFLQISFLQRKQNQYKR